MVLDGYGTLVAASLVLLLGRVLVARVGWLRTFTIPEPVAGGLVASLLMLGLHSASVEVSFTPFLQAPLMLTFFACIGLNADLASLRRGGRPLLIFLAVVIGLLIAQNTLGVALATLFGLDPLIGLLAGSIALSGGHGTGAAWGEVFSTKYGLASAAELAMACATFGLILGGLIGGPVARYLVNRSGVPTEACDTDIPPSPFEEPDRVRLITAPAMIETLALVAVCLLGGHQISDALQGSALELPVFVCTLFVGVVLRNGLAALGWYKVFERAVSVLGNVALALFLAMALMSLRLWDLASLALPMFVLLMSQTVMMAAYATFISYRFMGRNYDAAVIAAGHCGFGLGATPTAIANMQAVTDRFVPSHAAFLIVPMVGAFFIDIVNAVVIKLFVAGIA